MQKQRTLRPFANRTRGSRLHKAANITLLRLCHTWTENARRPARGAALFLRESVFSVGRDPCVPPKNAYPAAGHTGPALQDGMLNRAKRDVVPQGHLFRCAPLQDAVPYTRFNIPSRRVGPACPAEKCVPGGGTHGSRPTGAYPPKKTTRRPVRGAGTPPPTFPPPARPPALRIPPDPAPRPARWAKGRRR